MHLLGRPTVWFLAMLGILMVRGVFMKGETTTPSDLSDYVVRAASGYIAACWVNRDARKRKVDAWPMDHVMFFTLLLFPAYILVTRKWKGVVILVAITMVLMLPTFF